MSWYKMAKPNNWDDARKELIAELEREPNSSEIQNRMLQADLDDKNKVASKWKDKLTGSDNDNKKPSDFNKTDLEKGKKIELEHTNDQDIAKEIAIDHLDEHKDYYIGLEHMEDALTEIEERAKKK